MGDSTVDFLLINKEEGELKTITVYNNFERENFYLKSRMTSNERLGTVVQAASIRCVLTALNDDKFIVQGAVAGNTGFHSL
jgi:hypothetical protein